MNCMCKAEGFQWLSRWTGSVVTTVHSGCGGLEVACWPLVPKFADSDPAEAVGFFRAKKSSARLPSEGHAVDLRHVKDP